MDECLVYCLSICTNIACIICLIPAAVDVTVQYNQANDIYKQRIIIIHCMHRISYLYIIINNNNNNNIYGALLLFSEKYRKLRACANSGYQAFLLPEKGVVSRLIVHLTLRCSVLPVC